jgi:vancomycin permeability regulator SanA
MKKILWKLLIIAAILCVLAAIAIISCNVYVKTATKDRIITPEQATSLTDVDCILVLGCGVWEGGRPSHMLEDRLKRSIELFELGVAPKLLMSGDHGREEYDEVNVMKAFAVERGVPSEHIFMDHAGFSTYESMYRAKEVFQAKKVVIVTQGYHLYRAIYIARALGLEAYGVASDYRGYAGQTVRDLREVLARVKDMATCILRPEPTYLGDVIPIWGNGDITNDKT